MLLQSSGVLLAARLYRLLTIRIVIPRNDNRQGLLSLVLRLYAGFYRGALVAVMPSGGMEGFVCKDWHHPSGGCVAAYIYGASIVMVCTPKIGKIPRFHAELDLVSLTPGSKRINSRWRASPPVREYHGWFASSPSSWSWIE